MSIRYKVWDTKNVRYFQKICQIIIFCMFVQTFLIFEIYYFFQYDIIWHVLKMIFFTPDFVSSKEKTLSLLSTWTNPTIVLSEASCVATWPWTGCFLVKNGSNFLTSLVLLTSCILRLIIHRNKATSLWRVGTKIRKGIFKVKTQ